MKRFALIVVLVSLSAVACGQVQRHADLTAQKMCAEQARKMFHEDNPKANDETGYTSHYDAAANICYIMVHRVGISNGHSTVSDSVYDAFEGRVYASYYWINSQDKKYWEVAPTWCKLKPRGQEEITCKSSDEFERLVDKYFGIGL